MAAFFSPYRNLGRMIRLLVLAALVSCSEGALAGGAPRSTQTRKKSPTLSDRLAVAEATLAESEKENKGLTKQILAAHKQIQAANKQTQAAQASALEFSKTIIKDYHPELLMKTEKIGIMEKDIALLEQKCERYVQQCAKFEMQYCTRTVLHGLLREVLPQNPSNWRRTGGELYKQFVRKNLLLKDDFACNKLSQEATELYQELQTLAPFSSQSPTPVPSWVVTLKELHGTLNEDQHSLPQFDDVRGQGTGLAFGGTSIEKMFKQVLVFVALQKHLIHEKKRQVPEIFNNLVLLSAGYDQIAGRVQDGQFVPADASATATDASSSATAADADAADATDADATDTDAGAN